MARVSKAVTYGRDIKNNYEPKDAVKELCIRRCRYWHFDYVGKYDACEDVGCCNDVIGTDTCNCMRKK